MIGTRRIIWKLNSIILRLRDIGIMSLFLIFICIKINNNAGMGNTLW